MTRELWFVVLGSLIGTVVGSLLATMIIRVNEGLAEWPWRHATYRLRHAWERIQFRRARGRWPCDGCDRPGLCLIVKDGTQPCVPWLERAK